MFKNVKNAMHFYNDQLYSPEGRKTEEKKTHT